MKCSGSYFFTSLSFLFTLTGAKTLVYMQIVPGVSNIFNYSNVSIVDTDSEKYLFLQSHLDLQRSAHICLTAKTCFIVFPILKSAL